MVTAVPARPLPQPSCTISSIPSAATSAPGLPSDLSAVTRDMASWMLWLFLATLSERFYHRIEFFIRTCF